MDLNTLLQKNPMDFQLILDFDYRQTPFIVLDLTTDNQELQTFDIANPVDFHSYIKNELDKNRALFAIGRYDEDRLIYNHSNLFQGNQCRTIHLGIDLWVNSGIKVHSPLSATIHSFANNSGIGDYGPTIILEHNYENTRFFTLYGHLSVESLEDLQEGMKLSAGQKFASVGNFPENGNWPPHLHFQLITDMKGYQGDFPGVTSIQEREKFKKLCPDPNLVLGIKKLRGVS